MAVKTHSWISLWFLLTVPVIAWDVGYCMMRLVTIKTIYTDVHCLTYFDLLRPRSMKVEAFFQREQRATTAKYGFN